MKRLYCMGAITLAPKKRSRSEESRPTTHSHGATAYAQYQKGRTSVTKSSRIRKQRKREIRSRQSSALHGYLTKQRSWRLTESSKLKIQLVANGNQQARKLYPDTSSLTIMLYFYMRSYRVAGRQNSGQCGHRWSYLKANHVLFR